MSKYVPIEEMNESQLRAQLDAAYLRWDDIKKNDYSDGSVDCGQIDATCADEIVQYALFGELVFG